MALDERYIADITLEPSFIDKDTGLPLARGEVWFYEDENRNTLKPVYQLTGSPPNYTYAELPNPIILSSKGTFQDSEENNIAVYYKPYNDFDEVNLYYVSVYNEDGVPQFTREAWPPNIASGDNPLNSGNSVQNQLSNPQFVDVFFDDEGMNIPYSGVGNTTIEIAPNWFVNIGHTGSGTLSIKRSAVAGISFIPTNPAYTLDFVIGPNITSLELVQRLPYNSSIWGASPGSSNGYIASSITVSTGTSVEMFYRPSDPPASEQSILVANNASGLFLEYRNTAQLNPVSNTNAGDNAFIDIVVSINPSGSPRITSIQVAGLSSNEQGISYEQTPVNRQKDQLFNYYSQPLIDKPIPSYLVGWDFPLNPAQWGESDTPVGLGVNTSVYVWDQTIVFQESSDSFNYERGTNGCLRLTADVGNCQLAVIQYIERKKAREILTGRMSVNIKAKTSVPAGVKGIVSLWYTDDALLPDMALNRSLISSINADGSIDALHGNWDEVSRPLRLNGSFVIDSSVTEYTEYMIDGWEIENIADSNTANYMAIVVGFESINVNQTIDLMSISLCQGDIATIPAPQSLGDVLRECQRYYETSYISPADVGEALVVDGALAMTQSASPIGEPSAGAYAFYQNAFCFSFNSEKYEAPELSLYSVNTGAVNNVSAWVWGYGASFGKQASDKAVSSFWSETISKKNANYTPTGALDGFPFCLAIEDSVGIGWIEFHYIADARLGII